MNLLIVFLFLFTFTCTFIFVLELMDNKKAKKRDVNLERDRAEIESYLKELRSIQFAHEDSKKKLKK